MYSHVCVHVCGTVVEKFNRKKKKKENELSREDQNNSNHTRPLLPLNMH